MGDRQEGPAYRGERGAVPTAPVLSERERGEGMDRGPACHA
jgi:hypothetical protein